MGTSFFLKEGIHSGGHMHPRIWVGGGARWLAVIAKQ
jgi:hypothetical protein